MRRRDFLKSAALITISQPLEQAFAGSKNLNKVRVQSFNSNEIKTELFLSNYDQKLKIMQITDLHFSDSNLDEAGFNKYSDRMNNAYKKVKHYRSNQETNTLNQFVGLLDYAVKNKVELLMLTGDIFNYPSKPSVSKLLELLKETKIPFYYTTGNHDWHYEGMEGSLNNLRSQWINNALKPMYGTHNPLYYSVQNKGINMIVIDNSTYQISEDQFHFFQKEMGKGMPSILFVHIPLYMKGLPTSTCGHPDWGEKTDKNFEIERREKWSSSGNSIWTKRFLEEVYKTENLLAVFTGHHHENRVTHHDNLFQVFSLPAFQGYYRMIEIQG